jgi:hypothetical protein
MPRIATRNPHQLAYRQRFSVGVRMLGCLVLLAGTLVLIAAAAEAAKGDFSKTFWLAMALGIILVICGAVLLAGERGKVIDREQRTVNSWWAVGCPLWYSTRDVQTFEAVVIETYDDVGIIRWCVNLCGQHDAPLELFDLANQQAAEGAARQVAAFLALRMGPPPPVTTGAVSDVSELAPPRGAPVGDRWVYWRPWPTRVRLVGVGPLSVAVVFLLGAIFSAIAGDPRSLVWLAIAAPAVVLGLWLVCGGRQIEINRASQNTRVWRAWPWPPAASDLRSFSAVIVAPAIAEMAEGEYATCLVGLIGPEMRLELLRSMACEEAREVAIQLAAVARLPLIDESQPAVRSL